MLCREEASDLCRLVAEVPGAPPVIGVCKEQEKDEKPDDLGIAEFDSKYFGCGTLYLDEDRTLFDLLGNRKISLPMGKLLNPFKWKEVRADLKAMNERMKGKGVDGNMKGDGLVQGGVLVVGPAPSCDVRFTYLEETGREIPIDAIKAALKQLNTVAA